MDLSIYSLEDLVLAALKSEIEAKAAYTELAESVKNFILKERLNFLAQEEEKHRGLLERLYRKRFPDKELVVPEEKSPVPLPEIQIDMESMPIKKMLHWVASMELGHYLILESERDNARKFEDYDSEWPMMHVGP